MVKAAGASPRDIEMIAVARDPWARIMRKAWHALKMPLLARDRLSAQAHFASIGAEAARALGADEGSIPVGRVEHHRAHLASSFLVSPFDEAALFSIDGLGDFASAMWGVGRGGTISPMGVVTFPHSLGMFYTALTQYLGFPKYGDEYKVMGLASYGEPEMVEEFRKIVIAPNGGRMDFMLAPEYFTYQKSGAEMTWRAGEPTIGRLYSDFLAQRLGAAREPAEPVDKRHIAIAASMQRRLEEVIIDRLRSLQSRDRTEEAVPCGRGRVQLRRQRQDSGADRLRGHLYTVGGGRRGTGDWRGVRSMAFERAARARVCDGARELGARIPRRRDRGDYSVRAKLK